MGSEAIQTLADNLALVLVSPKYPENIGAAARVAENMGIRRLILVGGGQHETTRMEKMATHHASHLLERMEFYDTLADALSSFSWVVGTSARQGRRRSLFRSPREIAHDIVPHLKNNRVAILFGPEDRGLTNDDLKFCNQISTIPTAEFSSLNLAQAVAIHCYEVYSSLLEGSARGFGRFSPKNVGVTEMEVTYTQVEKVLQSVDFLQETDIQYWMINIRHFFGRVGLRAKEAKVIRWFCRQLLLQEQGKSAAKDYNGQHP